MGKESANGIVQLTHPSDNLNPFWVALHQVFHALFMALECKEKFGKDATSCCTHPITSIRKDTRHVEIQVSKDFDI